MKRSIFSGLLAALSVTAGWVGAEPAAAFQGLGDLYQRPIPNGLKLGLVPVQFQGGPTPFTTASLQSTASKIDATFEANHFPGDVTVTPTALFTLPNTRAFYANTSTNMWEQLRRIYADLNVIAGATLAQYDYVLIYCEQFWGNSPLGFAQSGLPIGVMGGGSSLTSEHEFGHLFINNHARGWVSLVANQPFNAVNFLVPDYGNRYTIMGGMFIQGVQQPVNLPRHFDAAGKWRLGLLPESEILDINTAGVHGFTLRKLEVLPPVDHVSGVYSAARIRRSDGESYWIYYLGDQTNPATTAQDGPMITATFERETFLYDMTPLSQSVRDDEWRDSALPVSGDGTPPITEPNGLWTIRNVGVINGQCQVLVTVPTGAPVLSYGLKPKVNLVSPDLGPARSIAQGVTYRATAVDPDAVPGLNGAGIASVKVELFTDPLGPNPVLTSGTLTPPFNPDNTFDLVVPPNSPLVPAGTYRLKITAVGTNGTTRKVDLWQWFQ